MLLNDFVKPILKESPGEELSDVLKDPKALKPEILEIITLLQKQVPKWATAPCMEVSSIPNRYFLGYRDSRTGPLDDIVQKFFFIGIDTRGTLDQTDNRHIWIGAKYGTPQFCRAARLAFIGKSFLKSFSDQFPEYEDDCNNLLSGIKTISSKMQDDLSKIKNKISLYN